MAFRLPGIGAFQVGSNLSCTLDSASIMSQPHLHLDLSPGSLAPQHQPSISDPPSPGVHRATNIDTLELLSQTSSIFNMLNEMLELGGGQMLPTEAYSQLVAALSQLVAAPIDPNDARARRIPDALAQITARGSKWPFSVRGKAKLLQRTWEIKYGRSFAGGKDSPKRHNDQLHRIEERGLHLGRTANLGDANVVSGMGSLRKLQQILDLPTPVAAVSRVPEPIGGHLRMQQSSFEPRRLVRSRSLVGARSHKPLLPPDPMQCGHLNFKVGDWWTRPLAAKADGIIDSATGITGDDEGAYALIITRDQEIATDQIWRSRYRSDVADPLRRKLLRNLRTQDPVRLLRSATQTIDVQKGNFRLRPRAGVRYDGLYRVTGYSVKKDKGEHWAWHFDFNLERLRNQPVLERALGSPTEEQIRASSLDGHEFDGSGAYEVDEGLMEIRESRRASTISAREQKQLIAREGLIIPEGLNVFEAKRKKELSPMSEKSPFTKD